MEYIDRINQISEFSMSEFVRLSYDMLPKDKRIRPWTHVGNHGKDLLKTEDQLNAYVTAYGEMHESKCKAAFQNFNFDELKTNFEIYDWGCGQGIGTLAFIDMLRARDKSHLLRKVTLIEPSVEALKRANANIIKATKGSSLVLPVQNYLPGIQNNPDIAVIEGVNYTYSIIIHIFSNILDIEDIDLEKMVRMVAKKGHTHYIMCMGPKNTNSYRIDKFCSAFNAQEYISDIDEPNYGVTTRTHHIYSCKTKCLRYTGSALNIADMSKYRAPSLICGRPIYDDYDSSMLVQNKVISEDLRVFYENLNGFLRDTDNIFLKPNINGDTPDIVVVRRDVGIVLFKIFEDDISTYNFKRNNDKLDTKLLCKHDAEVLSPVSILEQYQENLIKLHVKDMFGRTLLNSKHWNLIRKVVYFSKNTTEQIDRFFNGVELKYITLLGNDFHTLCDDLDGIIKFNYRSKLFDESIYKGIIGTLSPTWHSFKEGKHINLTKIQIGLAKSEPSRKKINGVAGSGKTQVLASRAVNANLRTGGKVLILTFNLALVNYIKYRLSEVRADFLWSNFRIINYHQLFLAEANNNSLRVNLGSFDDTAFFSEVSNSITKYSTILIDEVQDYKTEWLNILYDNFLEPNGEFVVFGDAKQNIYNRPLDANGQVRIGFIPGMWDNSLSRGFRFSNPRLVNLASSFQYEFFRTKIVDNIGVQTNQQELAFNTNIKYYWVKTDTPAETLFSNCMWLINTFKVSESNTVVLSQTCDVLRDISDHYFSLFKTDPITTFETKTQFEKLKLLRNVTDTKAQMNYLFWDDLKKIRRNKKIHFTMNSQSVKFSTIHSFKGWEAETVILILEPLEEEGESNYSVRAYENSAELIYTAITRARENLFIINCGNRAYHNFFKNFVNSL